MNVHILGICGTFMGGLAALAKDLKMNVSGSDQNIYPPMSTQLNNLGIELHSGYDEEQLQQIKKASNSMPDSIVIGNVMRRGHPVIEYILNNNIPFMSGPEWLAKYVLQDKHVLAVSGTHGKTTTTSMLAWILEYANLRPGFLIGGVAENFGISARLGGGQYFVIEADEYDCAFFDKRSKFIHYRPKTLIINNIEYDHADIFPDLISIQKQFHHLIRTVPSSGLIITLKDEQAITEVLEMGCWTRIETIGEHFDNQYHLQQRLRQAAEDDFKNRLADHSDNNGADWNISMATDSYHQFKINYQNKTIGKIAWSLIGRHNMLNALSAIAAANNVGVNPKVAIDALNQFKGVKRRLELKAEKKGIKIYDDFAHHPTAIQTTLNGLRAKVGNKTRIFAVVELRSHTMRLGTHQKELRHSFKEADKVFFFKAPEMSWNVEDLFQATQKLGGVFLDVKNLTEMLRKELHEGDQIIFMSNGGFAGLPDNFVELI